MAAAESKEDANQQPRDRRHCGAFAKAVVKFTVNLFISFLLFVCLSAWNSATQPDGFPFLIFTDKCRQVKDLVTITKQNLHTKTC